MRYPFDCYTHGPFEVQAPIDTGPPDIVYCPECHEESIRIWTVAPDIWYCQGAHKTDYNKHGDILEQANKQYIKEYGEKPPKPDPKVPRNLKEPF
jgi:hypothetical protein